MKNELNLRFTGLELPLFSIFDLRFSIEGMLLLDICHWPSVNGHSLMTND